MQVWSEEEKPKKKPANISESEIAQFALERENHRLQKKALDKIEKSLKEREEDIIDRMARGAKVLTRVFNVSIDRSQTKRNVKWKEVLISVWDRLGKNGEAEAEKVLDSTKPDVYPHLVISAKE